jgi:hypothetical protein
MRTDEVFYFWSVFTDCLRGVQEIFDFFIGSSSIRSLEMKITIFAFSNIQKFSN